MAENYDLIFGQSAGSQYAWSDSDYQNGWQTVGSTPPTAEQFDALQRRSDTKAKDLNNRLSPLETTASKALAKVTPAANRLPYFNSSNSATTTAISDFIKTLLDDKDAKTARATLGAPSTTGANASGSWDINAATATKLATPRKINITGNASGSADFDGSGNVSISTTVNESKHAANADTATKATSATTAAACSGNSATATKLAKARTIALSGDATGSATFDGSGDVSANVTVNESTHAAVADVVSEAIHPRGVYGNTGYIFYGTLTIPQDGDFFKLEVLGGNGFNADIGQSREGTLYFRTGNGNPAHYAAYSEYHRNGAVGLKFFVVKDSGTQYRIYSGSTNYTGTMQVIPYVGQRSSFDLALTRVSALPDGADEVEQQQLIYASTVNNYAPTKTGGGASGTWGIDISGNAASADSATNATHAASADSATNADKVDGIHAASLFYDKGDWDADNWATVGAYEVIRNPPVSDAHGYGQVISSSTNGARFQLYAAAGYAGIGCLHYRTGWEGTKRNWNTILDSENYNNYAPTKTGGGASGTWGINISGNAATATKATSATTAAACSGNSATADSATNADTVDGYHASDLLRTLGGNRTPVITDIFDRAGTIDMSTMSAADKATNKAKINKSPNSLQNIWNNSSGIRAYGGDTEMNGYDTGTLKLTQSYKNFDKILVVNSNDDGNWIAYRMWDVWELAHAFANSYRFNLLGQGDIYWNLYGTAKHGTTTDYAVSTDTVWSCQKENSGIIAIYGIKF